MGRLIPLRHTLPTAIAALIGVGLLVMAVTPMANAIKPKSWELTKEAGKHAGSNPLPDRYKNPEVWSWLYGEADTPSSYAVMEHYFGPAAIRKECDVKGFYQWNRLPAFFGGLPSVFYNKGPALERGQNECAASAEYPTKTFFMHPDFGSSLAAIVRWKSPVTATLTVSGSVQPTDSDVEGIVWQLDRGTTILLGPNEKSDNSATSFGPLPVSVNAGESLYFEVTRGSGGGAFDTTAVALHITA
jgi:hypothetical protein